MRLLTKYERFIEKYCGEAESDLTLGGLIMSPFKLFAALVCKVLFYKVG